MLAKYRNTSSPIKLQNYNGKKYEISSKDWTIINDVGLFLKLKSYPQVYDVISFFDVNILKPISNLVTVEKDIVRTQSKLAKRILEKMKPFRLQATKPEIGEYVFRVMLYNDELLYNYNAVKFAKALIYRDRGGIGDIIMTTPFLELARKKFPFYKLIAAYPNDLKQLIESNKFADGVISFENLPDTNFDMSINLSRDCIKFETTYQPDVELNRPEIFLQKSGFDYHETPRPKIFLEPNELASVTSDPKEFRIGLVLKANDRARSWPYFLELRNAILDVYPQAVVYEISDSTPSDWRGDDRVVPLFDLNLRDLAAQMTTMDLVVSADTGPAHLAGALRVPAIWLFTHIDGKIRAKNYDPDLTHVIQKTPLECPNKKPCWYLLPCIKGPSGETLGAFVPCSKAITVNMVMDKIRKVLEKPMISYCVVYHNKKSMTHECINRIMNVMRFNDELIVVDNGSSSKINKIKLKNVTQIRNKKNEGCIKARNTAAKKAKGIFTVFFDNDQFIESCTMHAIIQTEADLVGVEGWSMDSDGYASLIQQRKGSLAYVGAGGLFLKSKVLKKIGYFNEEYSPAWFEDPDLCFRAKELGYTIDYATNHKVLHLGHKTNHTQKTYNSQDIWKRNHKIFCEKWGEVLNPEITFSVILLSRNRLITTTRCVQSIYHTASNSVEVIVIDQASEKNVVENLKNLMYSNYKVIESDKNLGCGPGRNLGAKHATGKYLVFCDDDMILQENWDFAFLKTFKETKAIALSPNIIEQKENGRRYIRFHSTKIDHGDMFEILNGAEPDNPMLLTTRKSDLLPGGSLVVKAEAFAKISFNEHYIFGLEDYDWSLSMLQAGYSFSNCPIFFTHTKPPGPRLITQEEGWQIILQNSCAYFMCKWGDTLDKLWLRSDFMKLLYKGERWQEQSIDERKEFALKLVKERFNENLSS